MRTGYGFIVDVVDVFYNHALLLYGASNVEVLIELRTGYGLTMTKSVVRMDVLRYAAKNGHVDVLKELRIGYGLTGKEARANNNYILFHAAKMVMLEF